MKHSKAETALLILVGILVIGFGTWWTVSVWNECRADGKSVMYCITLLDGHR